MAENIKLETIADKIISQKDYYSECSQDRRKMWTECWKMYMSYLEQSKNPFLSNMFIPKTHEAVELLAAFLVGGNQSITVNPIGKNDTKKAQVVEKHLDFQWKKEIKLIDKLDTWIKQAILFGNGILKLGWDDEKNKVWVEPISLSDIFFSYYHRNIQDSPTVIHRIVKQKEEVMADESYKDFRKDILAMDEYKKDEEKSPFKNYDGTLSVSEPKTLQSVELFECWSLEKVITIGQTGLGWQILKEIENNFKYENGNKFMPFVKVRMKTNPLPNRAYDISAVEPTIKIQKAFNDMMNEVFDNVSLINNKMFIKRRGANINPMDLVWRPGGVITVENDTNTDIRVLDVTDIKQSALAILQLLDNEFQQASMVVNLLKGVPGADFATEAALGQQNVQTLLNKIDMNIKFALSELGQMVLSVDLANRKEIESIKVLDNDEKTVWLDTTIDEIKGFYDIEISADRSQIESKAVKQKQLLDLLNIISRDMGTLQKYPDLTVKIYKRWLERNGEGDINYFFEKQTPQIAGTVPQTTGGLPSTSNNGLTEEAIRQSTMSPMMAKI